MQAIAPGTSPALINEVAVLVEDLFEGRHPDYQKADLKYHTLDHTILATQCYIDLAEGRVRHGAEPALDGRRFSLGYAAILLHDSGYLKTRDDADGTGAKYTSSHVGRSCSLAKRFLPDLGCTDEEIVAVQNAISCTGVNSRIEEIHFRSEWERVLGCMVVTADYLGQMADPDYPEKLPGLFEEFEESNNFSRVPFEKRPFRSARELMEKTTGFWRQFALPKLERDYNGVYRVLAQADGSNPYIEAVEANLARITAMAKA